MKKQIVNIINFIRGVEPRENIDLILPLKNQVELLEKSQLPGTFLLQYDALINSKFTDILKNTTNKDIEIGVWLEIVKPLVEDSGLVWRGRKGFDWDWHANVGFSVGYSKTERMKIIDTLMERFRLEFDYYPKSVGSWIIDAFSLDYMSRKYDITASCNCKDQFGTDGYTLWGGYYGQAYYPSKNNAYTPAQTVENQIPVPIFKMLGSDPIYQYDIGLNISNGYVPLCQQVVTLEPVYTGESGGGGEPAWVDWYFNENFNGKCINFGYTQVGQENSFGWYAMKDGLTYQISLVKQLADDKKVHVMTLAESGKWFKENYITTSATAITALSDWKNQEHKSIWFNSKYYRMNIYTEGNKFWIRDWHIFDENYFERYNDFVCTEDFLVYDNLPVIDGNRWSGNAVRAGIYPVLPNGDAIIFSDLDVIEGESGIILRFETNIGTFQIECCDSHIIATCINNAFKMKVLSAHQLPIESVTDTTINFRHNNYTYKLTLAQGYCKDENRIEIHADDNGTIKFCMGVPL